MSNALRRRTAFVALGRALWATAKPGSPGVFARLGAVPRMVRATTRGEYDGGLRLALMGVAGLYIVSPIDLIPEAIFGVFGLVDDAAVAAWLVGTVFAETERYLEWERRRGRHVIIEG